MSIDAQLVFRAQWFVMSAAMPWIYELTIFSARWIIFLNVGLALFLFFSPQKRLRHAVYEAAWSVGVAALSVALIASLVQRSRPFISETQIVSLIPPPITTAFPSGHTSLAVAVAAAFVYADRRIGLLAILIATLTGLGRIAAGVHYPTDILGGIFVGLASFGIIRWIHHELARRDIALSAALHYHE